MQKLETSRIRNAYILNTNQFNSSVQQTYVDIYC
jgi:hypothetical protein